MMLIDRSGVSDASRVTAEGHVAPEQARAGRIGDRVTQGKCTLVESQWCGAVYRVGRYERCLIATELEIGRLHD